MECIGRTWTWTWLFTYSEVMGIGRYDPLAINRGAYAALVHGIASRPKPKPKAPRAPLTGGAPHPDPPNPRDAFAKAVGAISPGPDRQGRVC